MELYIYICVQCTIYTVHTKTGWDAVRGAFWCGQKIAALLLHCSQCWFYVMLHFFLTFVTFVTFLFWHLLHLLHFSYICYIGCLWYFWCCREITALFINCSQYFLVTLPWIITEHLFHFFAPTKSWVVQYNEWGLKCSTMFNSIQTKVQSCSEPMFQCLLK